LETLKGGPSNLEIINETRIGKMEKRGLEKCGMQILGNSRASAPSTKVPINETI
jgi:hypothetical protein